MKVKTTGNFTKVILEGLIEGGNPIQKEVLSSMLEELQKDNFLDKLNKKWVAVDDVIKLFEDDSITCFEDLQNIILDLKGE